MQDMARLALAGIVMCHPIAINITGSSQISLLHHCGGREQFGTGSKYVVTLALFLPGSQNTFNNIHFPLLLGCPF